MLNLWKLSGRIRTGASFLESLREMVYPERTFLKLILVNSIAISFLSLVIPVSMQSIITNLGILNQKQPILVMSVVLFIILLFSGGIQIIQFHAIEILRRRLFIRFGSIILNKSTRYLESHYKKQDPMQLAKRYQDVILAQSSMVIFFVDGIGFSVQYIISMGLLCLYHPYFFLMGIGITVLLFYSWKLFGPAGVAAGTPEADTRYAAMGWIDEVMRARSLFMSTSGREFAEQKFVQYLSDWNIKRGNLFNQQFAQTIALQLINALVYTLLLGVGYILVSTGELSIGQLVAAFLVVTMLLSSLPRLQNFYISIYDYSTNLDKIAEFYSHPEENDSVHSELNIPSGIDFNFSKAILDESIRFDFKVNAGERVYAYIRSFAAARMLVQALRGFLAPKEGELTIAGHRYDDIDFSHLRNHIAIVGDGLFFKGTIRENLSAFCLSNPSITEIEDALQTLQLLETVKAFPEGLETVILPNGYPLTYSEVTALQVARALLMRPGLILVTPEFDKMSLEKRKAAKKALLDKSNNWTVVFFSQRVLKGDFTRYVLVQREGVMPLTDLNEVIAQVEKYE